MAVVSGLTWDCGRRGMVETGTMYLWVARAGAKWVRACHALLESNWTACRNVTEMNLEMGVQHLCDHGESRRLPVPTTRTSDNELPIKDLVPLTPFNMGGMQLSGVVLVR